MNTMIKPMSGHCNIDCGYCFYKKGHTCGGRMSDETLWAVLDRLSVFLRGGYPLVFQGGEPLLAGHEFYKKVFKALDARGLHPQVVVQTNGTMLDETYAKMFSENAVLVGVSLDGTEQTHSIYRSDFHGVMKGIDCLRKYNCDFNILTVVTDELCRCLPEVYEFYRREGFAYQQYIPCLAPDKSDPYIYLSEASYGSFLTDLYSLWRRDIENGRYVYVRYFENLMQLLAGYRPEECGAGGVCSMQLLVESDGVVYPCDFFVEEGYRLGNLHTDSVEKLSEELLRNGFIQSSRSLPEECTECSYLNYCRGGCKRYRDEEGKYLYCNSIKTFLSYALPDMKKLLAAQLPGFSEED